MAVTFSGPQTSGEFSTSGLTEVALGVYANLNTNTGVPGLTFSPPLAGNCLPNCCSPILSCGEQLLCPDPGYLPNVLYVTLTFDGWPKCVPLDGTYTVYKEYINGFPVWSTDTPLIPGGNECEQRFGISIHLFIIEDTSNGCHLRLLLGCPRERENYPCYVNQPISRPPQPGGTYCPTMYLQYVFARNPGPGFEFISVMNCCDNCISIGCNPQLTVYAVVTDS